MSDEKPERTVHRASTQLLSTLVIVLGVAMLVTTVVRAGFGLTYGVILGILFILAGAGRLWASRRGV
jgi:hypothetical protein